MLVDQNYLCVVDKNGIFRGIITRKTLLKRINYMAHEFERIYDVRLKDKYRSETKEDLRNENFVPRTELLRGRAD